MQFIIIQNTVFLWPRKPVPVHKSFLADVRAQKDIASAFASKGIAALLIQNSRIADSRFKITLNVNEF
jgi:hypothetical protein